MQWTSQYLAEYFAVNEIPRITSLESQVIQWTPPTGLRYKVNVDGAVFKM